MTEVKTTEKTTTTKTTEVAKVVKKNKPEQKKIKVTLVRSYIGYNDDQRRTIRALGLNKINSSKVLVDNDCIRGMINKIKHIVSVEELN